MDRKAHWEHVYATKQANTVSWYQTHAQLSLELIESVAPGRTSAIVDVGGGASVLVDDLLAAGYANLTVLDISGVALDQARLRLGAQSASVSWLDADVLSAALPRAAFDVWHDRAVFHFLTDAGDRRRYVDQVKRALKPGGAVVIGTFAEDGPTKCSGLDVARYSAAQLYAELGREFIPVSSRRHEHLTPSGAMQAFTFCVGRFRPA
jgi:ubiquinone/menaquinone biosynthesis C-methylase UbiE